MAVYSRSRQTEGRRVLQIPNSRFARNIYSMRSAAFGIFGAKVAGDLWLNRGVIRKLDEIISPGIQPIQMVFANPWAGFHCFQHLWIV